MRAICCQVVSYAQTYPQPLGVTDLPLDFIRRSQDNKNSLWHRKREFIAFYDAN